MQCGRKMSEHWNKGSPYIAVGYHKGEMDFAINGSVCDLDYEEMNDLRRMIVVAIGTMEDMWRREQERRAPAAQTELDPK
jgi:hypothetical protein